MDGFHLDAGSGAMLAVSVAMLLLAAFLVLLDFTNRVHRAFALFLFLRALLDGSIAFTSLTDDLAGRLRGYLFIAVPFAALHFAYVYRRRYRRHQSVPLAGGWLVPGLLLLGVAICEVLYLWDHSLFLGGGYGPLVVFVFLPSPMYAAVALLFANDYTRETGPSRRRALLAAAVGFSLEPLYVCAFRSFDLLFDLARGDEVFPAAFQAFESAAYLAGLALVAAVIVQILRGARRGPDRLPARRLVVLWAVNLLSALAVAVAFSRGPAAQVPIPAVQLLQAVRAVWTLGLPVLATYALAKHRLFDADVRLRFAVKGTTLAAVFLAVFFVVNKVTENLVAESFGDGNTGVYVGGAVAGLLLFALAPLQRVADRLASKAVPAAPAPGSLPHPERAQIYREQLEIAWGDGRLTAKERLLFARLQERLGLSADEASRLETDVVQRLAGPLGARKAKASRQPSAP